jgi:4-alpha-glucanotransferase
LRASMRYAGGIRIDHVMGMNRLWLVPDGARATEGAYLNYPSETLFRLIALESWRHSAVVIGEDLGTLPIGFRDYLREQGVAGFRVLRFEKDQQGYHAPESWEPSAVAMTTTHDLVSTAGWWAGADIEASRSMADSTVAQEKDNRMWDRGLLWSAFERAGLAEGDRPEPEHPDAVVDAAVRFIAQTPCAFRLLAVEDALGTRHQPNVPGTTTEQPNWRHRLPGPAESLLDDELTMDRLRSIGGRDLTNDESVAAVERTDP